MATVTGITAQRALDIEGNSVVAGQIQGNSLVLTRGDNTTFVAGQVIFPISTANMWAQVNQFAYPVGSIYINADVPTNPSNSAILGGGTWVAFGSGRVPVGFDAAQTEFNATQKTGGEKVHALTTGELPAHKHGTDGVVVATNADGAISAPSASGSFYGFGYWPPGSERQTGGNQAHNNLQPYITVYMWRRTA